MSAERSNDVQVGCGCFSLCCGVAILILSIGGCQWMQAKAAAERAAAEKAP